MTFVLEYSRIPLNPYPRRTRIAQVNRGYGSNFVFCMGHEGVLVLVVDVPVREVWVKGIGLSH